MFPIRDHNPSGGTPYVTYALIVANVVIFLGYWLILQDENHLGLFFYTWGLVPARVTSGEGFHTLVSHMFLHGGWMHLAGNMLFLWIFGDNMESELGPVRYLLFYLTCGLAAAADQIWGDPGAYEPMVGASGAIAGVLGGYLVLFPKARVDVLFIFVIFFRIIAIPAWLVLGVWFALQVFSHANAAADGVAYLAHIGGFVAGLALAVIALIRRGGRAFWTQNAGRPPHPAAEYKLSRSSIPKVPRR